MGSFEKTVLYLRAFYIFDLIAFELFTFECPTIGKEKKEEEKKKILQRLLCKKVFLLVVQGSGM